MATVPTDERIRVLLCEAKDKSDVMDAASVHDIVDSFSRVENILDTPIRRQNHVGLLLSAALRHMKAAERLVISVLIGDEYFNTDDMALLVRLRLICSEIIGLLVTAQEETQLVPVRIR